jgi:uncharacterized protein YdeI (YjbR/CyaY-like superfamily)
VPEVGAVTYFASAAEFRRWLGKNHAKAKELWVGFHKKATGKPSMTWPQSVDEALCFGWIDGIRKRIDDDRYVIRFTPRKPTSIWSAINTARVRELTARGLMQPAGAKAFALRDEERSAIYSYENRPKALAREYETVLRANAKAWAFFQGLPPAYRRNMARYVMEAKQEETRQRRLARLLAACSSGKRL